MTKQCSRFTCPVEATISLIGGKYKAVILWHLMNSTMWYSQLHRKMPKVTDKMLAQQLRELEKDGLLNHVVYPAVPHTGFPKVLNAVFMAKKVFVEKSPKIKP